MQELVKPSDSTIGLPNQTLDFLWVELTSRCNLQCVHCYAESSPNPEKRDVLVAEDYFIILDSAASLGCRKVQFIGGEPTLVKELPDLIIHAKKRGFEFVEVFTNATRISGSLLSCFIANKVSVATSFYSASSTIHDTITKRAGSHSDTVNTIERLVDAGLDVRAGIIVMEKNKDCIDQTVAYLHSLGVLNVGVDRVRSFGRGASAVEADASLSELCGSCWQGSLCVSPDGSVSPCIMSKNWPVGSLLDASLDQLAESQKLQNIRARIYQEVWLPQTQDEGMRLGGFHMGKDCEPTCSPRCSPNCSPCYPAGKCNPELFCGPCGPDKRRHSKKVEAISA